MRHHLFLLVFNNIVHGIDTSKNNTASCTYLSCFYVNATSLCKSNAIELLQTDVKEHDADIALISETWFTKLQDDNSVSIDGYSLFRKDRTTRRGGGVCAYVKSNVPTEQFNPDITGSGSVSRKVRPPIEMLWLKSYYEHNIYFVGCCYHPPNPKYKTQDIIDVLSHDIEVILNSCANCIILILGDFNSLRTEFLECDFGLTQLVYIATHGSNILDKCFTNRPDIYNVDVLNSLLKTKHKALYVHSPIESLTASANSRTKVTVYDLRAHNIDRLRFAIANYNWSSLYLHTGDISDLYDCFHDIIQYIINHSVPSKTVSLSPRDPSFITPTVKMLLRKRNKLRRKGLVEKANELAQRINVLIMQSYSNKLAKLEKCTAKELWAAVKSNSKSSDSVSCIGEPNSVNSYFANICFDNTASPIVIPQSTDSSCCESDISSLSPFEVERMLRTIKSTSPGNDNLPSWLFRSCSVELADIIAHLFNRSFLSGTVPKNWKTAVVTPVPKVPKPKSVTDFRPISVTPILSRLAEKIVVKKWLRPSIPTESINDQYAFKPTGSTTGALIHLTHFSTKMLETNSYVRCLLIDFSKAFDVVDHQILVDKLSRLPLPNNILSWIVCFLSDRLQITKIGGKCSKPQAINRSIVQGSGLGPTLYIVMKSDLKPLSPDNIMFKFADDTTLLVPQFTDVDMSVEFQAILAWARDNKMRINTAKTKEIILHRPSPHHFIPPHPLNEVEVVREAKLLGVYVSDTFSMETHVNNLLKTCAQRLYVVKKLKSQGLSAHHLNTVTHALIISRILYAAPVFCSLLSVAQVDRINGFLRKVYRFGLIDKQYDFKTIMIDADATLFKKVRQQNHCLHHLLPQSKDIAYSMRTKGHSFQLPECKYNLHKHTFILRCLYRYK